jgi:hypothetical protein
MKKRGGAGRCCCGGCKKVIWTAYVSTGIVQTRGCSYTGTGVAVIDPSTGYNGRFIGQSSGDHHASGPGESTIWRYTCNMASNTTLSLGASISGGFDVDEDHGYYFYATLFEVHRVELDGSNDTLIRTVTSAKPFVDVDNSNLYYLSTSGLAGPRNISFTDFSGGGLTSIYTTANNYEFILRAVIPYMGTKIFFVWVSRNGFTNTHTNRLYSCDLDGSNLTMLRERSFTDSPFPNRVEEELGDIAATSTKIYAMRYNSADSGKVWEMVSMDHDGTNETVIVSTTDVAIPAASVDLGRVAGLATI